MLSSLFPLGRQRRYDLFLAFVPLVLLGAAALAAVLSVPLHLSAAAGTVVVALAFVGIVLVHPPRDRESD